MTLEVRILQIDVPEAELEVATTFWSRVLSARAVDAPGGFVHLVGATSALEVHVQPIGSGAARYHLDLVTGDRDGQVARLEGLGASVVERFDAGYTAMADPAGLLLCVIEPDAAVPTPVAPRSGLSGYLDAVFVDVPADRGDDELEFWARTLDVRPGRSEGAYTQRDGVVSAAGHRIGFDVQLIDSPARHHVDVSTPDVDREAERLETIGARRVAAHGDWITLEDPCGNLLCVVPTG